MTAWNWRGICIMKNKYILLEMNQRNEIRADVNMAIKSMELTEIESMNVKIDTGCPVSNGYTYRKK